MRAEEETKSLKSVEIFEQVDEPFWAAVEFSVSEADLVTPRTEPSSLTLEGLLERITDENLHQEAETGPEVGDEVW